MTKKATKKGTKAALRQKSHRAEFSAPAESDPPIIVSGGSVTISSKVFLSVSYDERTRRYIYYTDAVKIKKFKAKGNKPPVEEDTDDGKFTIDLFD